VFSYLSYRDPNLLKTLDIYDGTANFLRELEIDDDALTKAIIGTIGDVDSYQLPDAKGYSRYVMVSLFRTVHSNLTVDSDSHTNSLMHVISYFNELQNNNVC
jgi:Zn-dependent M16 (insulinase) family peptidase